MLLPEPVCSPYQRVFSLLDGFNMRMFADEKVDDLLWR